MTTIIVEGTRVYADTASYYGRERINSFNKVGRLDKPTRMHCKIEHENALFEFDDIMHGYVIAHSESTAGAFIKHMVNMSLFEEGSVRQAVDDYFTLDRMKMINAGNSFGVVFIGERDNHIFRCDDTGFNYELMPRHDDLGSVKKHMTWFGGAGSTAARMSYRAYHDAIYAVYQSFLTTDVSGGFIDIWDFVNFPDGTKYFGRVGICAELKEQEIVSLARHKTHDKHCEIQYALTTLTPDLQRLSDEREAMYLKEKGLAAKPADPPPAEDLFRAREVRRALRAEINALSDEQIEALVYDCDLLNGRYVKRLNDRAATLEENGGSVLPGFITANKEKMHQLNLVMDEIINSDPEAFPGVQ